MVLILKTHSDENYIFCAFNMNMVEDKYKEN